MNDETFKRHLKDLAHGHHHPEEHDWDGTARPSKKRATGATRARRQRSAKASGKK
jgi:hypothetical protein